MKIKLEGEIMDDKEEENKKIIDERLKKRKIIEVGGIMIMKEKLWSQG